LYQRKCIGQRHAGVRRDVINTGGSSSTTCAPPRKVRRISISRSTADREDIGCWNITTESGDVTK